MSDGDGALPGDPFELSREEIDERVASLDKYELEETEALQRMLRMIGTTWPAAKLNVEALVNMDNSIELFLAIKALTGEECRWALHNVLTSIHKLNKTPEEFKRWSIPPEFWPDGYEPAGVTLGSSCPSRNP